MKLLRRSPQPHEAHARTAITLINGPFAHAFLKLRLGDNARLLLYHPAGCSACSDEHTHTHTHTHSKKRGAAASAAIKRFGLLFITRSCLLSAAPRFNFEHVSLPLLGSRSDMRERTRELFARK